MEPARSSDETTRGDKGGDELDRMYRLRGPQVEPCASFWLDDPRICIPPLGAVREHAEAGQHDRLRLKREHFPDDDALASEFEVLKELEKRRFRNPYTLLSIPNLEVRALSPLSRFLHLTPQPFGAIFDLQEHPTTRLNRISDQHLRIKSGRVRLNEGSELARMFEEETPGIYHRHALNWLFFLRPDVSPPRQARVWMALDIAIYTALSAGWFYKWRHDEYRRLLRPSEYAERLGRPFTVLYDEFVNDLGHDEGTNRPRSCPQPNPGTPRHPAWPSGHSTYSAAASYLLEFVFSPDTLGEDDASLFERWPDDRVEITNPEWVAAELRRLANNIGEARLWAGVHWVADHLAGQRVGRSAAQAVIDVLQQDCIPPFDAVPCDNSNLRKPPSPDELEADCGKSRKRPCEKAQHFIPQPRDENRQELLRHFGVF